MIINIPAEIGYNIMSRICFYVFYVLCFLLTISCDDIFQKMPLDKLTEEIFSLPLDPQVDIILKDFREFPGEENSGTSTSVIQVKSKTTKEYIQKLAWTRCPTKSLNLDKYIFSDKDKTSPVVFDPKNQYVHIAYGKGMGRYVDLKEIIKMPISDIYYQFQVRSTQFGNIERRVLLYDKSNDILFLIFNN